MTERSMGENVVEFEDDEARPHGFRALYRWPSDARSHLTRLQLNGWRQRDNDAPAVER